MYEVVKARPILKISMQKINDLGSIFILAVSFIFYGQNNYLDLFLLMLIFGVLVFNIKKDIFYFYYFAIMFFEPVLNLPFVSGSVFRIYQFVFLFKILIDIKNRVKLTVPSIHKIFLVVMLVVWSIVASQEISAVISMALNLLILLYIFSRFGSSKYNNQNYSQLLFVMFVFSFLSGIYGLYNGDEFFMGSYFRLSSTIRDPNYTALFYLLGIFSLLGTEVISSSWVKAVLFFIMSLFIFSTVSLTGIAGFAVLLIFYYFFKEKKIAVLLSVIVVFFVLCIYYLPIVPGQLYGLKTRLVFSINSIVNREFTSLTSGRLEVFNYYITYFFKQGVGATLFGGQNIIAGERRSYFLNMFSLVSHNSYIDMLYAVGVVGTIFILGCFAYDIIKNIKNYKESKQNYYLAFAFLKLTILWFCMSMSIFPFRYFLTYMML